MNHALSCPKGGFPSIRHNEIRDLTANLLSEVCHSVSTKPHLQPISGEILTEASANVEDVARLDILANGFWGSRFERAFFDVRVFNPHAPSNRQPQLATSYRRHENLKKRCYEQRIREVEHGSFTPLVLSATGGLGRAATVTSHLSTSGLFAFYKVASALQHHNGTAPLSIVFLPITFLHSLYQRCPLIFGSCCYISLPPRLPGDQ